MLDALHVQGLAVASGDDPWKQQAVQTLQAKARGDVIEPERPRKASLEQLAAMGIGRDAGRRTQRWSIAAWLSCLARPFWN